MKKSSILDSLGSDIIFKEIFGTEKNIRFTELLLETLKNMPHGSLKDEEIKEMKSFQRKWFDEGRAIGYEEGKILGAKAAIAEKLLNKLSLDEIVEVTGLTKDENS